MRYAFVVEGRPVPQGSMTASYNRKQGVAHVHHVQGAALAQWRAAVRKAARDEGCMPFVLPVSLSIQFGMPRPKAHMELRGGRYVPKMQHYYDRPAVAPDIDKLIRAVMDALGDVCYHDDSQVVEVRASKVYGLSTYIEVHDEVITPIASGVGDHPQEDTGARQLRLSDMPHGEGDDG